MSSERRVLAAVRFVDLATGDRVSDPLRLQSVGRWIQNRSGDWVLVDHPDFSDLATRFEQPGGLPAPGTVPLRVVVSDPRLRWVARAFRIGLPRLPKNPWHDLLEPVVVTLGPGPAVPLRSTWSALRVHVRIPAAPGRDAVPLEGALVRVTTAAGDLRAQTLTDARGEATAPVARVPLFAAGEDSGPVLEPQVLHRLHVVVDPAVTDPETGRRASVADPDDLWSRRAALAHVGGTALLTVGRELARVVDVPL